jgi:hypothetical protein
MTTNNRSEILPGNIPKMEFKCILKPNWKNIPQLCISSIRITIAMINTTGVTSGAGTAYPSRAPEFTPGFKWGSFTIILRMVIIGFKLRD